MTDLKIIQIHLLRGPNIWANFPVLEAWVDLGALKDIGSDEVPGFNDRLKTWLPGMIEHRCSVGERGGFFQRLDRGTYPAHILEHVTLELQTLAGHRYGFGKARATAVDGVYKVVVRYQNESLVTASLHSARELLLAAYHDTPYDVAEEVARLRELAERIALGPSTMAIVNAARERGIPWRRLDLDRSLIQLGHGARQRRIWTAETDRSGAISEYIVGDKDLTRRLLRQAGVPVPRGFEADDPDDAWDSAESLGIPVVVKPLDANHGRGVFIDLTTEEQVRNAYQHALAEGGGVVVECFVPGTDHRLLVAGGRMVAASKGFPAVVVGDGTHTIRELMVTQLYHSQQAGMPDECPWSKIDHSAWESSVVPDLEDQGYALDALPRVGERVMVARFSNWCIDVTDRVHPSIRDHAITAAMVAGLDICGVDVVCRDIGVPLEDQHGAIVELNAGPNLLMYLNPAVGQARPVGEAIVEMLFPAGEDGRIPTLGISGSRGKTTCARLLAHLLRTTGACVGVASSDGIQVGARVSPGRHGERLVGAQGVLLHPWTEIAICEAGAEHVLTDGLGFDHCSVGVVLNVGEEHLGHAHVTTLEGMAAAKRCVLDVVMPGGAGVLNADDPLVVEMAGACKGEVIYFTRNPDHPVVVRHCAGGGRAVVERTDMLWLIHGSDAQPLCPLTAANSTDGTPLHPENVLAATAAAWAHGLSVALIAVGLRNYGGKDCQ
ncbi:MAG: cyanophycin synthetase [Akkermansiaceae bacterium]|nr:cyanophycin synthetase [Akkermansiaceae bacterium]